MPVAGGLTLGEIVAHLGGDLHGDPSIRIFQVAPLASAEAGQISFLANPKYRQQLGLTGASALIVSPQSLDETPLAKIVYANPYAYYARVVALLNPAPARARGVHPSAVVNSPCPDSATISAHVVIGEAVHLGENVMIHPGVVIGDNVSIGDDSIIYPNVVIYHDCVIGKRAVIQSGAVIGGDGFGFAKEGGKWIKIPQIGRVVIGDDVEIGANTTLDRGALGDTRIADGVKLDNLIQIAHNVEIGEHSALAGCVGIAGSVKIGRHCTIGGAGMISGHLELADHVHISGGTLVSKSIREPGQYTSVYPFEAHSDWLHNAAHIKRLAKLAERVALLEKQLEQQEKAS